jgi:hypothetical protein
MCGTQNRVQADAAGLKRRTTSLPSHSSPGARLKLTRSGGGKYSGPGLTEDSCLPSGLPSALGQTRVLRVLSVPLVSGSPVGKEVEAGEGTGQLRVLLTQLQHV